MNTLLKTIPVIVGLILAPCLAQAEKSLIDLKLDEGTGDTVTNEGSLPEGELNAVGNRKKPEWTTPGVNGEGHCVTFSHEQTGRPSHYQAIEIESDKLDNLEQFTVALWWKADGSTNSENPVAERLRTALFATKSNKGAPETPGIYIGLNGNQDGPQIEVSIGDGTNGGQFWGPFGLSPRSNGYDNEWNFLAVVFDGKAGSNRVCWYVGDAANKIEGRRGVSDKFDTVSSTGDSTEDLISIGDGLGAFSAFSSFSGSIDNVYVIDKALTKKEVEALRASAFNK